MPPAPVEYADGGWHVRRISGAAALKSYLCPGCNQQIPVGTAHVVAWSAERMLGAEFRRHWHTPCWERRFQRH
jgi:hypothetical protein